ncbi:hypothetical protein DIC82_08665 [Clostridium beijerinckii]|nr:hypothetical protein DIC82_08665 [Clostridium beijerinckii]
MSLRESLEIYNTTNREDCELLDLIYKKVSHNYTVSNINPFKIDKILEAFNNFDHILMYFEYENEAILQDVKLYIMRCKLDLARTKEVENRLMEWGIFFNGVGIEPTFSERLSSRYRKEFIVQFSNEQKKSLEFLIYLEYLFFVRNLSCASQAEQIKILEKLKVDNKNICNIFIEYIIAPQNGNVFTNGFINISENYIKKLMDEKFLLKTIKQLYLIFIGHSYNKYVQDLERIYYVQNEFENWVDVNKLKNFISQEKIVLLKEACLIEEIFEKYNHLIKLTKIGISLAANKLLEIWDSDIYFYETENEVFIPFNSNPLLLSKYIFNRNFVLEKSDFLITFKRKNT